MKTMCQIKNLVNPFAIGMGLLSVPVFSLLITSVFFVFGVSISPYYFPVSIVFSIPVIYLFTRENRGEFLFSAGIFLLILFLSLFLSSIFYDYSWDGRCYHQDTIVALKNGWNPVYEHHTLMVNSDMAMPINHYAKGLETISAVIYSTTGEIEMGKSINFILLFASALFFFNFLSLQFSFFSFWKKIFLSVIFSFSVTCVNQLYTFYIDWSAYSLLLILIPTLINTIKRPSFSNFYVIGSVVLLLITIKFNIIFWTLFTLFSYLIYILVLKKYSLIRQLIGTLLISGILGFFLLGFNPYMTNTLDHKNPLYPIVGKDKVEMVEWMTPISLQGKSKVAEVFISFFSYPNIDDPNVYVVPWNLKKTYLEESGLYDSRIGGFGVFFGWILILATVLYFNKSTIKNPNKRRFDIFLLILLISLFILPYGWFARYVPFFYAFPLVMLLFTEYERKNRIIKLFRGITYALVIVNVGLSLYYSCKLARDNKYLVNGYLEVLAEAPQPIHINFGWNIGFKVKADKKGIKYNEFDEKTEVSILGPPVYLDPNIFEIKNSNLEIR